MASVDVLNWQKKKTGSAELNPAVFEKEVRKDLLHSVVRYQLAKRRQGTHKAKTRAEVSGGGAKPFRQKGTGNARQGSIRSPLMEAGGVIFGPNPRNYTHSIPKKVRAAALRSALSHLKANDQIFVMDSIESKEGKTKELAANLKSLGLSKAVLVTKDEDKNLTRASGNLAKVVYYPVAGVNVYDLLKFENLVITQEALQLLEVRCATTSEKAGK